MVSEFNLFGQYIKCCIIEDMIQDIKDTKLNKTKVYEILATLQEVGMQNEYKQLIYEIKEQLKNLGKRGKKDEN